jgi:pimeloyl-ACP methyl ester carboxylesterase
MGDFLYDGYRITRDEYGQGDRVLVLIHGLLMNRRMFERLAPEMADRGNRVICVDLLGHGRSDRPEDLQNYSMRLFARQIEALLDYLELQQAVVGGTSLGANVALELAALEPERLRGMLIEMPVLDDALTAVAAIFTPVMLGLRFGRPFFELASRLTSMVPRTNYLIDIGLDWIRQQPGPSLSVLEGLLMGESAPRREERSRITTPALIIGHPGDPLHPFSDSDTLAAEMPNARLVEANSIIEWRLFPKRLNDELALFLDQVWQGEAPKPWGPDRVQAPGS